MKIFNDPIYGLVSYPFEFIYDLIDHPFVQRLRRIQQLGMSSLVYPGATHTRFHHALGVLHLGDRLIISLKQKGIVITDQEYEACLIATLLHDVGHGPYSHALEKEIIPIAHEEITITMMHRLNDQFGGRLSLAIDIFTGKYKKKFLSQMISGQIDVDRMDYLNRDSYYTGVAEGIIGYDRIIKMMNVVDNELVIEEKGLHSVEKFLLSRYFMYQQVYLHRAALSADHMLKVFFKKYKDQLSSTTAESTNILDRLMLLDANTDKDNIIDLFVKIDDSDILALLKSKMQDKDASLRTLARGLINRKLYTIKIYDHPIGDHEIETLVETLGNDNAIPSNLYKNFINLGSEQSSVYDYNEEISILKKDGTVVTLSNLSRLNLMLGRTPIFFLSFPKKNLL